VASSPVVEDLDVLVDRLDGLSARRPATPMNEHALQCAEEALDDGIVPAVASTAQAALDAVRAKGALMIVSVSPCLLRSARQRLEGR
jgi:hypothetical protein